MPLVTVLGGARVLLHGPQARARVLGPLDERRAPWALVERVRRVRRASLHRHSVTSCTLRSGLRGRHDLARTETAPLLRSVPVSLATALIAATSVVASTGSPTTTHDSGTVRVSPTSIG